MNKIIRTGRTDREKKERLLILDYKDGLELSDIPEFLKAVEKFAVDVKEMYPDDKLKLYFLPEDLANMMLEAQNAK